MTAALRSPAVADPCLTFLNGWADAISACETAIDPDAYWSAHVRPFQQAAWRGEVPDATSLTGAIAALRKIVDQNDSEAQDLALVKAALAFLEFEDHRAGPIGALVRTAMGTVETLFDIAPEELIDELSRLDVEGGAPRLVDHDSENSGHVADT